MFVVTPTIYNTNQAIYGQILLSVLDNTKLLVATRYDNAKIDNKRGFKSMEALVARVSQVMIKLGLAVSVLYKR